MQQGSGQTIDHHAWCEILEDLLPGYNLHHSSQILRFTPFI